MPEEKDSFSGIIVTIKNGKVTKVTSNCEALSQDYEKVGTNSYHVERFDWEHGGVGRFPTYSSWIDLPAWVKRRFMGKFGEDDIIDEEND